MHMLDIIGAFINTFLLLVLFLFDRFVIILEYIIILELFKKYFFHLV